MASAAGMPGAAVPPTRLWQQHEEPLRLPGEPDCAREVPTPQLAVCGKSSQALEFDAQTLESEDPKMEGPADDGPGPLEPPQPCFSGRQATSAEHLPQQAIFGKWSAPCFPGAEATSAEHLPPQVVFGKWGAPARAAEEVTSATPLPPQAVFGKWTTPAHTIEEAPASPANLPTPSGLVQTRRPSAPRPIEVDTEIPRPPPVEVDPAPPKEPPPQAPSPSEVFPSPSEVFGNEEESGVAEWEVVVPGGVNVRSSPDLTSGLVGRGKDEGAVVKGRRKRQWVALEEEPGYILMASSNGTPFLSAKQVSEDEVPATTLFGGAGSGTARASREVAAAAALALSADRGGGGGSPSDLHNVSAAAAVSCEAALSRLGQGSSSSSEWKAAAPFPADQPLKDRPPVRVPRVPPLTQLSGTFNSLECCAGGPGGNAERPTGAGSSSSSRGAPESWAAARGSSVNGESEAVDTSQEFRRSACAAAAVFLFWLTIFGGLAIAAARFEEPECPARRRARSCETCGGGTVFLPIYGEFERSWPSALRVLLYFAGMLWMFQGIGIICDQFMCAIEEITSTTRPAWVELRHGGWRKHQVQVWNSTIANLTLMALGSSAPEILLNVIEISNGDFFAGELGTSTIVGSAAFNLLIITAVCVSALPAGETRHIQGTDVFAVTALFSLFAYIWLVIILQVNSPDLVERWEALVTFLMFPLLLVLAYLSDRGLLFRPFRGGGPGLPLAAAQQQWTDGKRTKLSESFGKEQEGAGKVQTPSRAEIRHNVISTVTGGTGTASGSMGSARGTKVFVGFDRAESTVQECERSVSLKVTMSRPASIGVQVRYSTRDGSAREGRRYQKAEGLLSFAPGQMEKVIEVSIIDDQGWQPNERFVVELFDLEAAAGAAAQSIRDLRLGLTTATVTVVNDEMPGMLGFEADEVYATPSCRLRLAVERIKGKCGRISCQYATEGDTAQADNDFVPVQGTLVFEEGVENQTIEVEILRGAERPVAPNSRFRLILTDPSSGVKLDSTTKGGESSCVCEVVIDRGPRGSAASQLLQEYFNGDALRSFLEAWMDQFKSALYCNGSAEEQANAQISDWCFHCLALIWKVLFAFVPPPCFLGGWLCFFVALMAIGVVTALVGDLAGLLGCCTGFIPDDITAITFVALGTSLPDTFASKLAAQQDETADNSVGNVTGSNSVNVFLGVGVPYTLAAFYWEREGVTSEWREREWKGSTFQELFEPRYPSGGFIVPAESLGFSVIIFTACALVAIAILLVRRSLYGGELGGPRHAQMRDSCLLATLWVIFIVVSIVKSISTQ